MGSYARNRLNSSIFPLKPWRWLLGRRPWLAALLCICAAPMLMELSDVLFAHGHLLALNQQWASALLDVALGLSIGIMMAMLKRISYTHFPLWFMGRRVHFYVLGFVLGLDAIQVLYGWGIMPLSAKFGFNYLWHNLVVVPLLGYAFGILAVAMAVVLVKDWYYHQWWYFVGTVVVVALFAAWVGGLVYDMGHQYAPGGVPKMFYTNPAHPWHDGLVFRGVRWLGRHL